MQGTKFDHVSVFHFVGNPERASFGSPIYHEMWVQASRSYGLKASMLHDGRDSVEAVKPLLRADMYTEVARMHPDSALDEAFEWTNHIREAWFENPQIDWYHSDNVRSTSVGDIVRDRWGKLWLCMGMGWQQVTNDFVGDL